MLSKSPKYSYRGVNFHVSDIGSFSSETQKVLSKDRRINKMPGHEGPYKQQPDINQT